MRQALNPILDLLDEGLRLYRRSFVPFLLLAAVATLPIGAVLAAALLAADWLASGVGSLLAALVLVTGLPLSLYVTGALSKAALAAAAGEAVQVRRALAIGPQRLLGMGCFGTLFAIAASIATSAVSTICVCISYALIFLMVGAAFSLEALGGTASDAVSALLIAVGVVGFLAIYGGALVLNGAVYGSVVFAIQPFIHGEPGFGSAVRRSLEMLTTRLGQNLLAFLCTSLVFASVALAATIAVGVIIPLPALFLLGTESTTARAITAAAWVMGLSAALPLPPIWMALLYQRRLAAREGADLERRIAALATPSEA